MAANSNFHPIVDSEVISRVLSMRDSVCQSTYELSLDFLRGRVWDAVAVESAAHFDESDVARLAAAAFEGGCHSGYAIATEQVEDDRRVFHVPLTETGLTYFSQECAHFNYLLLEACLEFAVLCTVRDYFIIAGPPLFVESALPASREKAREDFLEFASSESWSERDRQFLVQVANTYSVPLA